MIDDTEALLDHALQIDTAAAYHAIALPIRTRLDQDLQFALLGNIQTAGRLRVQIVGQAIGSCCIEAVNPVSQCLAVHTAHAGRIRPTGPVTDRRQGQKPARSVGVLAARRKPPQLRGRIVIP